MLFGVCVCARALALVFNTPLAHRPLKIIKQISKIILILITYFYFGINILLDFTTIQKQVTNAQKEYAFEMTEVRILCAEK